MKALVVHQDSEIQNIELSDINIPIPAPGQVLIKVHVTPVHIPDLDIVNKLNTDQRMSTVPGIEGSGIIVQESKSLLPIKKRGRRVAFMQLDSSLSGTWAEYIICDEKYYMMLGENIDFLRGSTLMINPLTILMMHEKIKKRKHKVVIHSAISSDLAILFLRWCHYSNITCITIVSTQQEYEKLKSASPEYSLIQEHSTFAEELKGICEHLKPTCAFDSIGGSVSADIFNSLESEGELFLYGSSCRKKFISGINPSDFIFSQKKLQGLQFKAWFDELNTLKRLKYFKKIQGFHFLFNLTEVTVYPINQYKEALSIGYSATTTLLHFACDLQNNSKSAGKDIISHYIPESLQARINSLPGYPWEGPGYPVKVLEEGIYTGEQVEERLHGKGALLSPAGEPTSLYLGSFVEGKKQGHGRIVTESFWYEGDWANDYFNGRGKVCTFEGYSIDGDFVEGKVCGSGSEVLSNGERYEGEFYQGARHGHGKIELDGTVFTGEFKHGTPEGPGRVDFSDGSYFVGVYSNGKGSGELTKPDGGTLNGRITGKKFTESPESDTS